MTTTVEAIPRRATSPGRGRLIMDHKVVEKIASQAANEVATAGGSSGGVFGIGSHTDLSARPKVDVELSGRTASVDLAITVAYPTPIRQTTDQVRQHLIDRVGELTGVEVTRVDITVSALHRAADTGKEGLQ